MKTSYYVYELYDPTKPYPFYVGKGSGDRWKTHIKEAHKPITEQTNPYKCNVIRKIESDGNLIRCKKFQCNTEAEAFDLECNLIQKYGRLIDGTGCLTNIQPGGANNNQTREVFVFDRSSGILLHHFPSIQSASNDLGVSASDISMCLTGSRKTAKGFIFHHTKELPTDIELRKNIIIYDVSYSAVTKVKMVVSENQAARWLGIRQSEINVALKKSTLVKNRWMVAYEGSAPRPVERKYYVACDPRSGTPICCYLSLADAVHSTNTDRSSILRCANGKIKTANGFGWKQETIIATCNF